MTDIIAITKLRDVQCLGLRKSLPCTCILYLFHLKDCNGVLPEIIYRLSLVLLVVDVATRDNIYQSIYYLCCNAAPDSRIKYATTPLTLLSASLILDKSVRIF